MKFTRMDEDKFAKAREKAKKLVEWFEGKPLPECPFKLSESTTVLNFERAIETASARVLHNIPYSYPFMSNYHHLLTYKKVIENVSKQDSSH